MNHQKSIDLKAGSLVTGALEVLIKRDIVSKNRVYQIQDVMLKKWIQTFL